MDRETCAGQPGAVGAHHQFAGPLAVTISYTPEQLRALGISEADLTAFQFDETQPNGGAKHPPLKTVRGGPGSWFQSDVLTSLNYTSA